MASDDIFELDLVACVPGGKGPVASDGTTLTFKFPAPPQAKVAPQELSFAPPAISVDEPPQKIAARYLGRTAAGLMDGECSVVFSYGCNQKDVGQKKPNRMETMFGSKGIAGAVVEDLYQHPQIGTCVTQITAYSYQPMGDKFADVVNPQSVVNLHEDAGAGIGKSRSRQGGASIVGLTTHTASGKADCLGTLDKIVANASAEMHRIQAAADKLATEYKKHAAQMQATAQEVDDDDELDMGSPSASPKAGVKMDLAKVKLSPLIPLGYHDNMMVLQITVAVSADAAEEQNRRSKMWATAAFVVLPHCERPEIPGAHDSKEMKRYEMVQKLNINILSILNAVRMKRRRIPFGATKITSTFRGWYRQTMEREKEKDMIKRASFRKTQEEDGSPAGSPRAEGKPPTTRSLLMMDVGTASCDTEIFHQFVAARRLCIHGSFAGQLTRHINIESMQMAREAKNLIVQLEVAKQVHGYKPELFGVDKKVRGPDGEELSVKEREEMISKKREDAKRDREAQRDERIRSRAQATADEHMREVQSEIDERAQEAANIKVLNDQKRDEIKMWQEKDMSVLDNDLANAKHGLQEVEKSLTQSQGEQKQLTTKLASQKEANERRKQELQAQARKAVEEKDRQVKERRQWAHQQAQLQEVGIRDLRARITQADEQLRSTVQQYLAEEKQANRGVQPSQQEAQNLLASAEGLGELLDQLMPPAPSAQQQRRLDAARRRVLAAVAHETVTLRKQTRQAGAPPPTYPGSAGPCSVPLDVLQPVVRVHLSVEGVAGLVADASRKGRQYSVAAMRNGRVHETPRRRAEKGGVVEWGHTMSFLTRLAPPGEKAMDLLPCCIAEYMADGSLSESLPFDVDLGPLACQPPKQVVLLPLASSPASGGRVRVSCHVRTTRVRPRALAPPRPNPLRPLGDLWGNTIATGAYFSSSADNREWSRVGAGGDSSGDEGAPPPAGVHADPTKRV